MAQSGIDESERRVQVALDEAEVARRERRYEEGIALLTEALRHGSLMDAVYYRLGNLHYDAGDLKKAEDAWTLAIEHNPEHVNAHYNLAAVYKQTGRVGESIRMQKRAVRLQAGGKARHARRPESGGGGGIEDDPGVRKLGRYLVIQGMIFVVLLVLLFFICLYIAGLLLF